MGRDGSVCVVARILSFSGEIVQRGQNVFHSFQVLVLRITSSTAEGDAATRVLAITAKFPPLPYVGTGIAGTMDAVTPDVGGGVDSVVGG